jgi:hypothetical protein
MKLSHSKYKNTGLIFELLTRKMASDTLSGKKSYSLKIIKEHFVNSEISKELKIYQELFSCNVKDENKAYSIIDSTLNESKKINRSILRKEKYNLIKEIKKYYEIDDFFKSNIPNYKTLASIYNIIEESNSPSFINPSQIIKSKETLIEHITKRSSIVKKDTNVMDEYENEDKGTRILTYKILLEKFNSKYNEIPNKHKSVLKFYINNIDESPVLKNFINEQFKSVKTNLELLNKKVDNKAYKIKINEVVSLIKELPKNHKVKDNDVLNLLQYLELENELENIT